MMPIRSLLTAAALWAAFLCPALAQSDPGRFPANTVLGNPTGASARPQPTTAPTWFDSAFCSTVGYIIARTTGGWACAAGIPVPVTWFGARCDSATDDTTNILAAKDATPAGGTLLFPAGLCLVLG